MSTDLRTELTKPLIHGGQALIGGIVDQPHCVIIHDASTGSADELHGDTNTNIAPPSFSPVHFDEAKGPANDVQTAENRGMLNKDHCIIIQGLPESSASTPRERVAADLEQFQKLLNEMLQPTKDVTVPKAFRLGSPTNAAPRTRPRRLKIVLGKTAQLTCSTEALWLTIRAPGSQSLDILTVYRPPRNDPDADAQLLEELRLFSTRPTTLIVGDFNAPHINWSSASADCSKAAFDQQLLRTSDNLLLTQHVMFPMRVREGQQMNCLDLVFTKSSGNIDVVNCLPPSGQSGHVVLMWKYTLLSIPAQPLYSRPNIWLGDFEQMKKDLSPIDWASTLSGDVGEVWCPDAIPAKLMKELAPEMCKPLSLIFQTSFVTGCLPSDWKSATITPLFKGGSRASANNYRPVSLTTICCKITQKIIKKALMQFLEQHNLLSDAQHSFRSGRSCLTNLLFTLERWTKARDEGDVVHATYIDFKKAFDSVPHQRLSHKLRNAGICGRLLV
ncbi:hypothetical protein SprV_0100241900 [Sparganum proliferum]